MRWNCDVASVNGVSLTGGQDVLMAQFAQVVLNDRAMLRSGPDTNEKIEVEVVGPVEVPVRCVYMLASIPKGEDLMSAM